MMTDSTCNPLKHELQVWCDTWRACLQDLLSQVSGQPQTFELASETMPRNLSDLCYIASASGAVQGQMALRLSTSSALRLTAKFLGQPDPSEVGNGGPATLSPECGDALDELLRQISGLAATAIGGAAHGPVQLAVVRAEGAPDWEPDAAALMRTRDDAGAEIALEITLNRELAKSLLDRLSLPPASDTSPRSEESSRLPVVPGEPTLDVTTSPPACAQVSSSAAEQAVPAGPCLSDPNAENYQRLLEVGLGVKLRFGTRRMLLRDVLALNSGAVVELDNQLNSPVDLLLDGRVIARGDVVVVDGKYGLRVTEVVDSSPQSRWEDPSVPQSGSFQ